MPSDVQVVWGYVSQSVLMHNDVQVVWKLGVSLNAQ